MFYNWPVNWLHYNKNATQYIVANPKTGPHASARSWKDVTATEIKKFFTLSSIKAQLHPYWSQNPLLKASVVNVVMPRNQFQTITAFLDFADNSDYAFHDLGSGQVEQGSCYSRIYCW